jgi:hypothetical protein
MQAHLINQLKGQKISIQDSTLSQLTIFSSKHLSFHLDGLTKQSKNNSSPYDQQKPALAGSNRLLN